MVHVVVLEDASNYIDDAKLRTRFDIDVFRVFMLWEYKATRTLHQKVNPRDFITLEIDVFIFGGNK